MTDIAPYDSLHPHTSAQPGLAQTHLITTAECVLWHSAHEPTSAYPVPGEAAHRDTAPRTKWSIPANQPIQRVFIVVLRDDGLDDFELPVQTITMRLRDTRASYVSCNVPNPTAYTDGILDRSDGTMHILAGDRTADGERHLEELIYANIDNIYLNQGETNNLTLTGLRYITHDNPKEVALDGISRMVLDERERYRVRCGVDFFVRPTDEITARGETFTADLISYVITPTDAYMEVEGS